MNMILLPVLDLWQKKITNSSAISHTCLSNVYEQVALHWDTFDEFSTQSGKT